jgi:hypothetical protein
MVQVEEAAANLRQYLDDLDMDPAAWPRSRTGSAASTTWRASTASCPSNCRHWSSAEPS